MKYRKQKFFKIQTAEIKLLYFELNFGLNMIFILKLKPLGNGETIQVM